MSLMPDCTCDKQFGYVFGEYSLTCPRHAAVAKWWKEKQERRAAELRKLRQQALTRPVHGGYPDAPAARPSRATYERIILDSMEAEDAAGGYCHDCGAHGPDCGKHTSGVPGTCEPESKGGA